MLLLKCENMGNILWINGAFGSGKKQAAHEICRRLASRHEAKGWAADQIPVCLAAFADPVFDNRIDAAALTIPETAERIADIAGFSLSARLSPFQQKLAQFRILLCAIRK